MKLVCIGIHVHQEPERLLATLASVRANTSRAFELLLLPDGPDEITKRAISALGGVPRSDSPEPRGVAASFNRLAATASHSDIVVLLESGCLVGHGWLDGLVSALEDDPRNGLAGPTTNACWNEQGVYRHSGGTADEIACTARDAAIRFGREVRTLEPLYSLADFCYAVRREVIEAIGAADEAYGLGPCWEMDYNVRAARAGFRGVWACAAYVHRAPLTARRRADEVRRSEASRRRYQDKFCGARLQGHKSDYRFHCRGDACPNFAPLSLIAIRDAVPPPASTPSAVPPAPLVARSDRIARKGQAQEQAQTATPNDPLVTCIMPTSNRRSFLQQAIRCFLRQDYTNSELLVLDDGTDSVSDCMPDEPRIRYIRLDRPLTIGAKRNLACSHARGDFILNWDDDDWYPPWRVRMQVRALLDRPAEVCGSSRILFYEPAADQAWEYRYAAGPPHWLAGSTLAYRKSYWERNRFLDIQVGEDAHFVWKSGNAACGDLSEPRICIAMIHPGNTSRKETGGTFWHPQPSAHVHELLGADVHFYRTAQSGEGRDSCPLVSCIMPTHDRRLFVPQAIRYFLRQDYPNKELIIVDDGRDSVADLVPTDPRIRFVRLPHELALGAKRNLAVSHAQGPIVAHWDDDDWYHERYLTTVAGRLAACGNRGALAGLGTFVVHILGDPTLRICRSAGMVGATFCYYKTLWRQRPFREVSSAEDYYFLQDLKPELVHADAPDVFMVVRHTSHTWTQDGGRDVTDSLRRLPPYHRLLPQLLEPTDCEFYEAIASGRAHARPPISAPLVSCIMPTHDRRGFVPQAIKYFQRQTYPCKELLIVDDGSDRIADLIPGDPRVKYVPLDRKLTVGAKRNLAVERSEGTFILHWDDDDWYSPERIRRQLEPLLQRRADVSGLKAGLIWNVADGTCWTCDSRLHAALFYADVHGGTLGYTRGAWELGRFPDLSCGEDAAFLRALACRVSLAALPNDDTFIYIRHGTNAWQFPCGSYLDRTGWKRVAPPAFLEPDDCRFYERLAGGAEASLLPSGPPTGGS